MGDTRAREAHRPSVRGHETSGSSRPVVQPALWPRRGLAGPPESSLVYRTAATQRQLVSQAELGSGLRGDSKQMMTFRPSIAKGLLGEVGGSKPQSASGLKYVFLFIGDGMGAAQRRAAELYLAALSGKGEDTDRLIMNQLPAQGMTSTDDPIGPMRDSASTGTALATGHKTAPGVLGMDPAGEQRFDTIAELAKSAGMRVGIISSVSIDHATPASFYAHQPNRSYYHEIAHELANSRFDYFAGGPPLAPSSAGASGRHAIEAAQGERLHNSDRAGRHRSPPERRRAGVGYARLHGVGQRPTLRTGSPLC